LLTKNELLSAHGINYNDLPSGQKRGTGVYWEGYEKPAWNLKTEEAVTATRRRPDLAIPSGAVRSRAASFGLAGMTTRSIMSVTR